MNPCTPDDDQRGHAGHDRIFAEQVRELYVQRIASIPSSLLTTGVIAYLMRHQADPARIVQWMGLMVAGQIVTILGVLAYRRASIANGRARRWAAMQGLNTTMVGITWGLSAWFIWPDNEHYRLLLLLILAGVSAIAAVGTASLKRAVAGMLLPIWALVLARLHFEHTPLYQSLSVVVVLFVFVMSITSYRIHALLRDSIRLRCINLDLIADLRVQKNLAQAADRAKTGFLAAASHDLRQPVHALGLLLRVLDTLVRSSTPNWQQITQVVDQSRKALKGLSHLLAALLDISRLDAGVVEIKPEPVRLQALFDQLQTEYETDAMRRGLSLRFHPTTLTVISDAVALRRILGNFISNALRYTPAGGVLIGARSRHDHACIEVWDTGPGIPDAARDTIFEEFVQLGNSERNREQGLGLGLAIVRRLAQSQGQRIEVRSVLGRGSVFKLYVALPPGHANAWADTDIIDDLPPAGFDQPTLPPRLALSDYTLLLIDDDPDVLDATAALLQTHGVSVLTAGTLDDALAHPSLQRVDVLLVDHRLPGGLTGARAIERLRAQLGRALPAVLITGDTGPHRLREATASGLPLLHKPLDPEALLRAIDRCLNRVDRARDKAATRAPDKPGRQAP